MSRPLYRIAPAPSAASTVGSDEVETSRKAYAAAVLGDGRSLLTGGADDPFKVLEAAEVYDTVTISSLRLGSAARSPRFRAAVLLADGRVLMAKGVDERFAIRASDEIYNPPTGKHTPLEELLPMNKVGSLAMAFDRNHYLAEVFQDDDSGGGLFGTNARLRYRAAHTYTRLVVVQDAIGAYVGGYLLTVSEAPPDAVAVSPPPTREVTTVDSPFRLMGVYESAQYPFSIQYPADWVEQPAQLAVTASFAADQNTTSSIAEEDLVALELGEGTVHDFVDLIIDIFAALDIERS